MSYAVNKVLQNAMSMIRNQLPPAAGRHFVIDEKIASAARNQFNQNFNLNRTASRRASIAGSISVISAIPSLYLIFTSPLHGLALSTCSFALNRVWVKTRNREGYMLHAALYESNEEAVIRQLSLGANVYQRVWTYGGAAPTFIPFIKGGSSAVMSWFAQKGFMKVVAYLAMLEPDVSRRALLATEALGKAHDAQTAQLLLDLGANIQQDGDRLLFSCCLNNNLDLLRFFVAAGAKLDVGIVDYQKWQANYDLRQRQFGHNWYPGNNDGVDINLHPDFATPLERFIEPNVRNGGDDPLSFANRPAVVLEAMGVDPSVYLQKSSAEELYHSLNRAGIRIRRQRVDPLFEKLSK